MRTLTAAVLLFSGVASADPALDALLTKTAKLGGSEYGKTAEDSLRKLGDESAERVAASYILALANKDVAAFMKLVPPTGLTVVDGKKKKHLTLAEVEVAAKKPLADGRPSLVHAYDDVEDVDPTKHDWMIGKRGKVVTVNPNGSSGIAQLKRGADGSYHLDGFAIERNDD